MDSSFSNLTNAIKTNMIRGVIEESTIITLDNIGIENDVANLFEFSDGGQLDIPMGYIDHIIVGDVKFNNSVVDQYR